MFQRLLGLVCVLLGIFLFVPGLMSPEQLFVPLVTGALAIVAGVWCMLSRRAGMPTRKPTAKPGIRRFRQAATTLLQGLQALPDNADSPVTVQFSQDGMALPDGQTAAYTEIDTFIETAHLYLLTWNGKVTVLQKSHLSCGDHKAFVTLVEQGSGIAMHHCRTGGGEEAV